MEPAQKNAAEMQITQDERWMRHAMALAARAEGETGEILVGTVLDTHWNGMPLAIDAFRSAHEVLKEMGVVKEG